MAYNKTKNIILAATIAALPASAYALDFTPDASRVLSDPTYIPLQGQIEGVSQYRVGELKDDQYNHLGVKTSSLTETFQNVSQTFSYGITDDITIRASETYVPEEKQDYTSGTEYSFDGFSDPTFTAIWRALDQKSYPVSFDFVGSYSPNWVSDKHATLGYTGSVARGGDEEELGIAVGYKTHSFTIQGNGGATHYGNSTYYAPTTSNDGHTSSYWSYFGGVQTQTRLTDLFSFNAGYTYTTFNNENVAAPTVNYTRKFGAENDLNAALNYQIIPNRLVAELTYDYFIIGDGSSVYSTPTSDSKTKNETENLFGARLLYAF